MYGAEHVLPSVAITYYSSTIFVPFDDKSNDAQVCKLEPNSLAYIELLFYN